MYHHEGFPAPLPFGVLFATFSNEDMGLPATITTTATVMPALPYPATLERNEEVPVLFALDVIYVAPLGADNVVEFQGINVYFSMLRKFDAAWNGIGDDASDEDFKSYLDGPYYVGDNRLSITATASVEGVWRHADVVDCLRWFPPNPLDLLTPLFIHMITATRAITLATNAAATAIFDNTEQLMFRMWYLVRQMTPREQMILSGLRYLRMNA